MRAGRAGMMTSLAKLCFVCCCLASYTECLALDILRDPIPGVLTLSGPIEHGDFLKFVRTLKAERQQAPKVRRLMISLSSEGGSFVEAIKFGRFAREAALTFVVGEQCYSACFLVLVGGVNRILGPNAQVGIHRPYYDKSEFAELSLGNAEAAYKTLEFAAKEYLSRMDVPRPIVDRMFSTPSSRIHVLRSGPGI